MSPISGDFLVPIQFDKYAKFINLYHIILKHVVILTEFVLNSEEL